jgi:hypothetical protein
VACKKWSLGTGCSVHSTRTAAAIISTPEGRREGPEEPADVGGPGFEAARHRTHCALFAAGAWPLGTSLPHLQDRLPKELRLAGIKGLAQANRWLAKTYIPAHNAAFAIAAEQEGSAFLKDRSAAWTEILCVQDERVVGNDNTVKWNRLCLQLPPSRLRPYFVKATVFVHEYPDGTGMPPGGKNLTNGADTSRATKTGQVDELATVGAATMGRPGVALRALEPY